MKILKAFIKHFGAPQRKKENKTFCLLFILMQLSEMHGAGTVKKPGNNAVQMSLMLTLNTFNSLIWCFC